MTNGRVRLKRRYNGSRDRELITHKSQSNYGAYASASIEKKKERNLSPLFLCLKRSPLCPITDSVNFAFNYAKVHTSCLCSLLSGA